MDKLGMDGLDSFLDQVNEIESIVKGLSSKDETEVKQNLEKSDILIDKIIKKEETSSDGIITKTGFNKTFINKTPTEQPPQQQPQPAANDQEGFMRVMEQDAKERHDRKQAAKQKANEIKVKGNEQFFLKNYEKALEFYTEAINVLRDNTVIYTNRAQCYIMMKRYEEAIEDCNWAMRVDEKFLKAYIHKGRALTCLKKFDEALTEFETAKTSFITNPADIKIIDDYIKELERCRQTDNQEKSVEMFLKETPSDNSLAGILDNINKKTDEHVLYYSGGLRALGQLLTDTQQRTVFRVQNGFNIFEEHPIISKYIKYPLNIFELNTMEIDLVSSIFELLQILVVSCDENINSVFKINDSKLSQIIMAIVLLTSPSSSTPEIKQAFQVLKLQSLSTLKVISENEYGIQQMCLNFDLINLLNCLTQVNKLVSLRSEKDARSVRVRSLEIIQNLALNTKAQSKLKPNGIQSFMTKLTESLKSTTDIYIQSITFTIIYALTNNANIRNNIAKSINVWEATESLLVNLSSTLSKKTEDLLNIVLCLLVNVCSTKSELTQSKGPKLIELALKFVDIRPDSALKLIGNLIQHGPNDTENFKFINKNIILKLIDNIKANRSLDQSLKVLALSSTHSNSYCDEILTFDQSAGFLYKLFENVSNEKNGTSKGNHLNFKNFNETQINNSAMCMSNCVNSASEKSTRLSQLLSKTNIVMDLLYLARDGKNVSLQKNCGILLAKLCKANERHLLRLRELHGIEILHQALKNCDL